MGNVLTRTIMQATYINEGLADIEQDVMEAIEDAGFPVDEDGFDNIEYTITITAKPE